MNQNPAIIAALGIKRRAKEAQQIGLCERQTVGRGEGGAGALLRLVHTCMAKRTQGREDERLGHKGENALGQVNTREFVLRENKIGRHFVVLPPLVRHRVVLDPAQMPAQRDAQPGFIFRREAEKRQVFGLQHGPFQRERQAVGIIDRKETAEVGKLVLQFQQPEVNASFQQQAGRQQWRQAEENPP